MPPSVINEGRLIVFNTVFPVAAKEEAIAVTSGRLIEVNAELLLQVKFPFIELKDVRMTDVKTAFEVTTMFELAATVDASNGRLKVVNAALPLTVIRPLEVNEGRLIVVRAALVEIALSPGRVASNGRFRVERSVLSVIANGKPAMPMFVITGMSIVVSAMFVEIVRSAEILVSEGKLKAVNSGLPKTVSDTVDPVFIDASTGAVIVVRAVFDENVRRLLMVVRLGNDMVCNVVMLLKTNPASEDACLKVIDVTPGKSMALTALLL